MFGFGFGVGFGSRFGLDLVERAPPVVERDPRVGAQQRARARNGVRGDPRQPHRLAEVADGYSSPPFRRWRGPTTQPPCAPRHHSSDPTPGRGRSGSARRTAPSWPRSRPPRPRSARAPPRPSASARARARWSPGTTRLEGDTTRAHVTWLSTKGLGVVSSNEDLNPNGQTTPIHRRALQMPFQGAAIARP